MTAGNTAALKDSKSFWQRVTESPKEERYLRDDCIGVSARGVPSRDW